MPICNVLVVFFFFFFQAEDGIRDAQESRGLGDVYKRQVIFTPCFSKVPMACPSAPGSFFSISTTTKVLGDFDAVPARVDLLLAQGIRRERKAGVREQAASMATTSGMTFGGSPRTLR
eukprot:TRINITY_DN1356_c0_g1_i14.p1 TRINITY_DN1356_c0_g1~~TRINITY_DN1356_c0_g1_i14.p1  ORF type:complete len:118 (+),score=26.59 TRINITY_DN1356_c0_g1_i14:83-436(+)